MCVHVCTIAMYIYTLFYHTVPTEAPRNVRVTINSSRSIMLTWERPSQENENGLLVLYHVIVMENPNTLYG